MGGIVRASIVIVTYGHRAVIDACLTAVTATVGPDDEIVVVDNASADGTADAVARHAPRVRLARSGVNLGYAGAGALAADISTGRYLVFLNPDTVPRAGWVDALCDTLDSQPTVALIGPKLLQAHDPSRLDAYGVDVHVSLIPTSRAWGAPAAGRTTVEEVASISGACFAVDRDVYARLGGFDEHAWYMEDVDLSLRARLAGLRCAVTPRAEVLHVHPPGVWPAKLFYIERSRWWLLLRTFEPSTLAALMPTLLIAESVAWGFAFRAGPAHVAAKARAWASLIGWLPRLRVARVRYRPGRVLADRDLLRRHGTRLPLAQAATGAGARAAERLLAAMFAVARTPADALAAGGAGARDP